LLFNVGGFSTTGNLVNFFILGKVLLFPDHKITRDHQITPLCSFVSFVVKGFDQRKSAAKSFRG